MVENELRNEEKVAELEARGKDYRWLNLAKPNSIDRHYKDCTLSKATSASSTKVQQQQILAPPGADKENYNKFSRAGEKRKIIALSSSSHSDSDNNNNNNNNRGQEEKKRQKYKHFVCSNLKADELESGNCWVKPEKFTAPSTNTCSPSDILAVVVGLNVGQTLASTAANSGELSEKDSGRIRRRRKAEELQVRSSCEANQIQSHQKNKLSEGNQLKIGEHFKSGRPSALKLPAKAYLMKRVQLKLQLQHYYNREFAAKPENIIKFTKSISKAKERARVLRMLVWMLTLAILANSFSVAESVDCFKCSSRNGSNPACEDPFHNLNTTKITSPFMPDPAPNVIYHTPCYAGKKGREGLFPASACIKLTGTFDNTGETLVVRHCALDSGTLTQDTELARMSHCGKFQFEGDLLKGCVLACPEDACNSSQPKLALNEAPLTLLISAFVLILVYYLTKASSPISGLSCH